MRSELRSDEELAKIQQILEQLPEDLEDLVVSLKDTDHLVRMCAAGQLGMKLDDPLAIEPLLGALEDEHHEVRRSAALSLGHYRDPKTISVILEHLLNDPSPGVRVMCVVAAGMIAPTEAMDHFKAALKDPYYHVRYAACWQFAHENDTRAIDDIRNLLGDPEPMVRSGAATVLIRLGKVDEQVMDLMASDPSWDVRKDVVEEIVKAGIADRRITDVIERLMQEPEAQKYENCISEKHTFMESDEYKSVGSEIDEELSDEEKEQLQELEDMMDKPLSELLEKARRPVGE